MRNEIDRLLEDAAAEPTRPIDTDALRRRAARARQRDRVLAGVGVFALAVVMITALMWRPQVIEFGSPSVDGGAKQSSPSETTESREETASSHAGAGHEHDPLALIGLWHLDGVDEEAGAILRLDTGELTLWRTCAVIGASWRANTEGLFVPSPPWSAGDCGPGPGDVPTWLLRIAGFRTDGDQPVLLDAAGETVVRLLPGQRPSVPPDTVSQDSAEPPVVTDEDRDAFRPAAPLPQGLVPADAGTLIGRWIAEDSHNTIDPPYVQFKADLEWVGSDGCNTLGGRWVAGPDGAFLATSGGSNLMGCDNIEVDEWLTRASRAGFEGRVLVLVDADGRTTGRLFRDSG